MNIENVEIIECAKAYLHKCCEEAEGENESLFPWRHDKQFKVKHTSRVLKYCEKICNSEKISEPDRQTLVLACVFHDIGSLKSRENHALESGKIADVWLNEYVKNITNDQRKIIIDMIVDHSNKTERCDHILSNILKDADLLDEIGVMSIFMTSMRVERDLNYFESVLSRIYERELPYCDKVFEMLYTESAKKILQEKKQFIIEFAKQLSNEIEEISI